MHIFGSPMALKRYLWYTDLILSTFGTYLGDLFGDKFNPIELPPCSGAPAPLPLRMRSNETLIRGSSQTFCSENEGGREENPSLKLITSLGRGDLLFP